MSTTNIHKIPGDLDFVGALKRNGVTIDLDDIVFSNISRIAVGTSAGQTSQGLSAVAVGTGAGQTNQSYVSIAIGNLAGQTNQGSQATAVGDQAGQTSQGNQAVAIGFGAGYINQGSSAIALGPLAGVTSQGVNAIAVGTSAGQTSQGVDAVAVGDQAGQSNQGSASVAVGLGAGQTSQGNQATAVGYQAGQTNQAQYAVAIGPSAGEGDQGGSTVAVGRDAGKTSQGNQAIAIGRNAGKTSQGAAAIAVGYLAGETSQGANSIILNATGVALDSTTASSFHVKPVRGGNFAASALAYTADGEIVEETGTHFDASGNVGIGVVSPVAVLDVAGSGTNGKSLQLRSGDDFTGTDSSQIIFSYSNNPYNASGYAHSIRTRHNAGADAGNAIDFWLWNNTDTTNASTLGNKRVMTIEGTGNVGVGVTNPVAGLDIRKIGEEENLRNSLRLPTNGGLTFVRFGRLGSATDEEFAITKNITRPSGFSQDDANYGSQSINFSSDGTLSFSTGVTGITTGMTISPTSNVAVDTDTLFVDSVNDRVGIGLTAPDEALHVNGNIRIGKAAGVDDNSQKYINSGAQLVIHGNDTDLNDSFVGTVVQSGVSNVSSIKVFGGVTSTLFQHISLSTKNTERMRIEHDGNVGIGKTDPGYALDVVGEIYASGDIIAFSDERKKTDIEVIPNALEKVLQLRGVTFNKLDDDNRRHAGVIAQEVEKVLPEVVYTAEDGTKSVAYGNLVGLLIEAIKELAEK
jgi:hypothetical protein